MDIKNSILADAIDTLTALGKKAAEPKTLTVNGRSFLVTGSGYEEIDKPSVPQPEKATVRSLNALVALVKTENATKDASLQAYFVKGNLVPANANSVTTNGKTVVEPGKLGTAKTKDGKYMLVVIVNDVVAKSGT